jgi:hypothetical protein
MLTGPLALFLMQVLHLPYVNYRGTLGQDKVMFMHIFFIACILFLSYIVYATWFKDLATRQWEHNRKWIPFMPEDLRSFTQIFKAMVVIIWLFVVIFYILILLGIL